MANHAMKGLIMRSLLMRDLTVRGLTERNLIGRGDTKRSPTTMNLTTTIVMRRRKISRGSMLLSLGKFKGKSTAWEILDDKNLSFLERVRAYDLPDKFKMPQVEKYDGIEDPKVHLEAF